MFCTTIFAFFSIAASATLTPMLEARAPSTVANSSFNLVLESVNSTLAGSYLFAGHAGAAVEQLVVGSKTASQDLSSIFNFNVSQSASQTYANITGVQGQLVWTLHGTTTNESESLTFIYSAAYDTAVPEFVPTYNPTILGFVDDLLTVTQYTDDTKTPVVVLDRWYVCQYSPAQTAGYSYFALAWKLGSGTPDNASCSKVSVKRVYN